MYPMAMAELMSNGDFQNENVNRVKQVHHLTEEQYVQVMDKVTLLRTYEKDGFSPVRNIRGRTEIIYVVVTEAKE